MGSRDALAFGEVRAPQSAVLETHWGESRRNHWGQHRGRRKDCMFRFAHQATWAPHEAMMLIPAAFLLLPWALAVVVPETSGMRGESDDLSILRVNRAGATRNFIKASQQATHSGSKKSEQEER
jgi:hypothetical protein